MSPPRSMIARFVVPIGWTFWGIVLLILLYWPVRIATEPETRPEAGRGLGLFVVFVLLALHAGAGVLFAWVVRRGSSAGLIALAILLGYPLVAVIARPVILAYKSRQYAKEAARVGDFRDARLAALADAIRANDAAALERLLGGQAPPAGKDRAGNDLLAYAADLVRDRKQGPDMVRVLLAADADARGSRTGEGVDLINHLAVVHTPEVREVIRLLLEHGADPNVIDPRTATTPIRDAYDDQDLLRLLVEHGANIDHVQGDGVPAVVHFIASQQWENALYLIEKGARLDVRNADGLSVDYYLDSWKESVYGNHPEGWDRVRAAIAARRSGR
jgi:hypothetical protein